jgi:hypothetical protein
MGSVVTEGNVETFDNATEFIQALHPLVRSSRLAPYAAAPTCAQPRAFGDSRTSIGPLCSASIFVNSSSE